MTDHDSSGPRWRSIFERTDEAGVRRYYAESEPGAGPRHHDDLQVTPETAAKAMLDPNLEDEVRELLAVAHPLPVAMLLGVTSPEPGAPDSITSYLATGDDLRRAHEHARNITGYVVGLAVLADYSQRDPR